jgi:hypothetical protein
MSANELETRMRSNLARTAAEFPHAEQARQRLLSRDYHPRIANRPLTVAVAAATAVAAVVLASGLGLSGVLGGAGPASAHHGGSGELTAFTLVSNANGTTTLTLDTDQFGNATALREALAQHGIPAVVTIGSFCRSNSEPPDNGAIQIGSGSGPGETTLVINPAALPAGTELSFGYFQRNAQLEETIIYDNAYSCTSGPHGF